MMKEERLEEINRGYQIAVEQKWANRISDSDIEWLIEQAEYNFREQNRKIEIAENRLKEIHRLQDENDELAVAYDNARKEIMTLKNRINKLMK